MSNCEPIRIGILGHDDSLHVNLFHMLRMLEVENRVEIIHIEEDSEFEELINSDMSEIELRMLAQKDKFPELATEDWKRHVIDIGNTYKEQQNLIEQVTKMLPVDKRPYFRKFEKRRSR